MMIGLAAYKKSIATSVALTLSVALAGCSEKTETAAEVTAEAPSAAEALIATADQVQDLLLTYSPVNAYFANLPIEDHSTFNPNDPQSLAELAATEDAIIAELQSIDPAALPDVQHLVLHAQLLERMEATADLRVCKAHLWNVNHMFGSHNLVARVANFQPVDTPEHRQQALTRWQKIADYYGQELQNLQAGLDAGYSMPKPVVRRVVAMVRGLVNTPIAQSPLMGPANRSNDPDFQQSFQALLEGEVLPAMTAWVDYLETDYMAAARDERAITAIPDGAACYQAYYRSYTSLKWSADRVHQVGSDAVARQTQSVIDLGQQLYGLDDFASIIAKVGEDKQGFDTPEAMLAFYEAVNERALEASKTVFQSMPKSPLAITAIAEHEQGQGRSAHYLRGDEDRPGQFRYDPTTFDQETYAGAEIVTVHEGYPGHHLQISLASEQAANLHPIQKVLGISAYSEGWARYSEALAEELGVYQHDTTLITRRAWPARGMVSDTGMHVLGWNADDTITYLRESGRFLDADKTVMIDRMAALPAQLTSYDSGAQEIFALRKLAEDALGEDFDLKTFHYHMLKYGNVPLWLLRQEIEAWIASETATE